MENLLGEDLHRMDTLMQMVLNLTLMARLKPEMAAKWDM